jgi:hypothetical protein
MLASKKGAAQAPLLRRSAATASRASKPAELHPVLSTTAAILKYRRAIFDRIVKVTRILSDGRKRASRRCQKLEVHDRDAESLQRVFDAPSGASG